MTSTSLMWFRRDLRLADNPALLAACTADEVVPLFVLDPLLWGRSGPMRRAYLKASLRALDESMGGALVVRTGDPRQVVPQVAAEVSARSVHLASDYNPYGRSRDEDVARALTEAGVEVAPLGSPYAVAPGRVLKSDGERFKVYSPFFRAWLEHGYRDPVEAPGQVSWAELASDGVPDAPVPEGATLRPAGEAAAHQRWAEFRAGGLQEYGDDRNFPGRDGVSRMSTYLRWGEIHPRTMLRDIGELLTPQDRGYGKSSASVYRRELAWRDFYADVMYHRPDSVQRELQESMTGMTYDEPGTRFEAWKFGRTGYPLVDAGMRQMLAEGVMHNRVRMVVASFLVKDLHLDWRLGCYWFMERLADGDLASNWHGWQWVAGVGTDPAPYYRIFNPTAQSERFDPNGDYIRRYVPELADVPAPRIHQAPGVPGYPEPIVDHAKERKESLARYERVKG